MAILFAEQEKTFTLHTKHSTYQMIVGSYDYLLHLYYGRRIEQQKLDYLLQYQDRGFSGNPYEAGKERTFSLDTQPQEYSVFGIGDFRTACLRVVNPDGSYDAELKYQSHEIFCGKEKIPGLPASYGTSKEVETLKIYLKDTVSDLSVCLEYSVFEELDIITRHAVITSAANGTKLERAYSMCLDFENPEEYDFINFYGKHTLERQPERFPLRHGLQSAGSIRGCSSHQQNPFVILCTKDTTEEYGSCYGISLMYSGNFTIEAEVDQINQVRLVAGISEQGFLWQLDEGETFHTPEVLLSYSNNGFTELSNAFHKFLREHVCRGKYQKERRPILINNWEATYFDFTAEKLLAIAADAKELGIEMLVMDDGWFGKRDDDYSGLGDWVVNKAKLPGGLKPLVDAVNQMGLKFGIWFEPEMINEDSDLYRTHKDWCLKTPVRDASRARYQYVLDMTREDVRIYLFESISKILEEANISYVKWDMNRHLTNIYSVNLPAQRQGEVYHRYVLGLYELLEQLITKFPNVLFEGCSGGGGRFDAGMLYYTPQIWCSDNTDAAERLKIQYGTSFGYPISTVGSHVSAVPNHQTGRITPLAMRGITAMAGTFGYELDLTKLTEEEKEEIKTQLAVYKRYYEMIQKGFYYRLTDLQKQFRYAAWEFVSEEKQTALLQFVLLQPECNAPVTIVKMRGLAEDKLYQAEFLYGDKTAQQWFLNEVSGTCYRGSALMYAGFRLPELKGEYTALQLAFCKIQEKK